MLAGAWAISSFTVPVLEPPFFCFALKMFFSEQREQHATGASLWLSFSFFKETLSMTHDWRPVRSNGQLSLHQLLLAPGHRSCLTLALKSDCSYWECVCVCVLTGQGYADGAGEWHHELDRPTGPDTASCSANWQHPCLGRRPRQWQVSIHWTKTKMQTLFMTQLLHLFASKRSLDCWPV